MHDHFRARERVTLWVLAAGNEAARALVEEAARLRPMVPFALPCAKAYP